VAIDVVSVVYVSADPQPQIRMRATALLARIALEPSLIRRLSSRVSRKLATACVTRKRISIASCKAS